MTEEEKRTFCRIVATLLVSDLKLQDGELEFMERLYARLGLDADAQREIQRKVNLSDDIPALALSLSEPVRQELLRTLDEAARADGEIAVTEVALIAAVRRALT
jgi:uncharacterized tellurite resistance protein B-like protein